MLSAILFIGFPAILPIRGTASECVEEKAGTYWGLMLERNPDLSPEEVREILGSTAKKSIRQNFMIPKYTGHGMRCTDMGW